MLAMLKIFSVAISADEDALLKLGHDSLYGSVPEKLREIRALVSHVVEFQSVDAPAVAALGTLATENNNRRFLSLLSALTLELGVALLAVRAAPVYCPRIEPKGLNRLSLFALSANLNQGFNGLPRHTFLLHTVRQFRLLSLHEFLLDRSPAYTRRTRHR